MRNISPKGSQYPRNLTFKYRYIWNAKWVTEYDGDVKPYDDDYDDDDLTTDGRGKGGGGGSCSLHEGVREGRDGLLLSVFIVLSLHTSVCYWCIPHERR